MLSTIRKNPIKSTGVAGAVVAILTYCSTQFVSRDAHAALLSRVNRLEEKATKLDEADKVFGAILCGVAVDLNLPTAKAECKNIILIK